MGNSIMDNSKVWFFYWASWNSFEPR